MGDHVEEVEIPNVSSFLEKLEGLPNGAEAFYRGQAVDKPLLPAVARKLQQVNLAKAEKAYLDEFRRRASAFRDVRQDDDWSLLALAQHNGAPTRLLDWSRNPLAALWFSVASFQKKGGRAVIWRAAPAASDFLTASDRSNSPFEIKRTKWFEPPHSSPRILAQEGYFSVHKYWVSGQTYVPLEAQKEFSGKLLKYVVKKGREELMFIQLDHLGMNFANLFPDLYGLSKHLAVRHDFMVRELAFGEMIRQVTATSIKGSKPA